MLFYANQSINMIHPFFVCKNVSKNYAKIKTTFNVLPPLQHHMANMKNGLRYPQLRISSIESILCTLLNLTMRSIKTPKKNENPKNSYFVCWRFQGHRF